MTCCQAKAQDRQASINSLYPAAIRRLPTSIVTLIVPINTMSITVLHAFTDRRSVGQMKLPAALLMTIVGSWPRVSMHSETASRTECASRTSHFTADTYNDGLVYATFHARHTSPPTPTITVCLHNVPRTSHFTANTYNDGLSTQRSIHVTLHRRHLQRRSVYFTADIYNDGLSTRRSTHVTLHRRHLQRRYVNTTFHTRHTSLPTPTTTVCLPLTWACVPTLDRIGYGLPDYFWKVSKNSNTI